ncbi:hypothetical protein O181_107791 [Austropuccinia psidii MF-1]|uniref:Integrase catalytic domain-containing protein n=1 Tax=Austropuccinia psidii MF-1 TaxID=1389203 RepID=A0A9Q3JU33_9BASI|nr:hypothetical protein [Austropuccinia psidii MF-1]
MIWNQVISHTGLFHNIISDRDPNFTSPLAKNLDNLFAKKLSFSTAYHPQTDGLAETMIKTLEGMIKRFCAYGLEFQDSDGFNHDWCTLILALEIYGKRPAMLEKSLNPRLPYDTLKKELMDINPKASSSKIMLYKERHHTNIYMQYLFKYTKKR